MSKQPNETDEKPLNPLRHVKPRLVPIRLSPFKQQFRNARSGLSFFSRVQSQLEDNSALLCPECGQGMVLLPNDGNARQNPAFECSACGHIEVVTIRAEDADRTAHVLEQQSNQTFYIGFGIAIIAALIAVFNGSIFTFIGGVLIGTIVLMQSAAFRYRAWQYQNRRLYESRPPFAEWVREQFGLKRRGPNDA